MTATSAVVHEVLGMSRDKWDAYVAKLPFPTEDGYDVTDIPISKHPDWHRHPILGIIHSHKEGATPHSHKPEVRWGEAIPIEGATA